LVYYLELSDYCLIASEVLGLSPEQVAELPNIGLADSALAIPRAAFGDHEAFPTLIEKAAVLVERLTRNHPLHDGNKRCAFLALERFLAVNGRPIHDADPDADVPMMDRIAAGDVNQDDIISWIEQRSTQTSTHRNH
jgi:death on curing protein